jgi:hypothetical protein
MLSWSLPAVLLAAALGAAAQADERPSPAPREGIESLEAQLARAADRVSLPHAARLLGRVDSARGFRLPGYGVVFVLTPRALPGGEGHVYVFRGTPKVSRMRVEARPARPRDAAAPEEQEVETLERQVLVLQHETEAMRRLAEEEMDRLVETVRVRVSPHSGQGEVHVEVVSPPDAPPPPAPPAPPAAAAPPEAPDAPAAPPAPPWRHWFERGAPQDGRDAAAVVSDVRRALVDVLAAPGVRLEGLPPDERVSVAVDFVAGGLFAAEARPEKTLVLSARVRDLAALARGAIDAAELRRRVEVTEY